MKLKAFIFDADGVLFNTEPLHVISWKKAFNYFHISYDKINFEFGIGLDDKSFLTKLIQERIISEKFDIEKIIEKKNQKLIEIIKEEKDKIICDGVLDLLSFFKDRYKFAIASNSGRKFIYNILEITNILSFFDVIVTRDDVKNPKPDPEIYMKTLEKLKISPENVIVFEDSEIGIQSAKRCNIFCVGLLTTQKIEKIKNADIIIDKLTIENIKKIIEFFEEKNEKKYRI